MVTFVLLIIIYLAFISLGLPDALLGVTWPIIRQEWMMRLDAAGMVSIVITVGTIASSLLSGRLIRRFGEGKITFLSGLMTGIALLGFAYSPSYIWFVFLALPLGFGAGSVDTALNHYVALHFKAHHMNWLHSFWGVGATAGPILVSVILKQTGSWRLGYQSVAIIQLILAAILFISLPLWKKHSQMTSGTESESHGEKEPLTDRPLKIMEALRIKGVPYALLVFMTYCAVEFSVGLWGSSYLVQIKGVSLEVAARWVAFYFAGITVGRILAGFISFKLSNKKMTFLGVIIALAGAILLIFDPSNSLVMVAFVMLGLGFAPIFPAMTHETPIRFGRINAQSIIGFQMASAYIGIAVFPPLLGVLMEMTGMMLFPIFVLLCIILLLYFTFKLNRSGFENSQ
ncbi:MAG: MFS transporter [Clostridia bacterium]|nr:MFS transporter [Clostridia bacterium]